MEQKPMFVGSGGMKLPIGYRFHPTDEELVVHYLRRKVLGLPLPAAVIPELDVFQSEPWRLLPGGGLKENRYFFSRLKGGDRRVVAGSGYWKATSKTRLVLASVGNQVVGFRRTLVFSQGKHSTRTGAQWVMHEFHLLGLNQQLMGSGGDRWVIYRLHQRKRKPRRREVLNSKEGTSLMELYREPENSNDAGPPQPSSPCSSGITEVSFSGLDQDEVTSFH